MEDYSQSRSFNLGIAENTGSIGAALIYDDLVYAQKVFGNGYFFRSHEQMSIRFPLWNERTIRRYVATLEEKGWLSTKIKKVNNKPTCHYKITRFLSAKMSDSEMDNLSETLEMDNLSVSINIETTKETKNDIFLSELISLVNKKEKSTSERLRMLNARLKDYSKDEILGAAKTFSRSQWHRENNQMSIDNLLAPSKFGRWYAQRDTVGTESGPPSADEEDLSKFANQKPPEGLAPAEHNRWVEKKMKWDAMESERYKKERLEQDGAQ